MTTITEERTTASVKLNAVLQQMLENITPSDHLDTIIFDFIQNFLLKDGAAVEDWKDVIGRIKWKGMDADRLLDFIMLVGDHEYGDKLVCAILNTNKLSLDDFEEISLSEKKINFNTIDKIILKILDLGAYFDQVARGQSLSGRFMNATIEFLNKNNNLEALQEIADQYEWGQFDVKFLRKLAFWACDQDQKYSYVLLNRIIATEKLYLEDYGTMSDKLSNSSTKWIAHGAVLSAKAFNLDYANYLAEKFVPRVYARCEDSLTVCEEITCAYCPFGSLGQECKLYPQRQTQLNILIKKLSHGNS